MSSRRQILLTRVNCYSLYLNTLLNKSQVIEFIIEVVVTDRFHCNMPIHPGLLWAACLYSSYDLPNFKLREYFKFFPKETNNWSILRSWYTLSWWLMAWPRKGYLICRSQRIKDYIIQIPSRVNDNVLFTIVHVHIFTLCTLKCQCGLLPEFKPENSSWYFWFGYWPPSWCRWSCVIRQKDMNKSWCMVWYDMIYNVRYDTIRYDMIWYMIRFDTIRYIV